MAPPNPTIDPTTTKQWITMNKNGLAALSPFEFLMYNNMKFLASQGQYLMQNQHLILVELTKIAKKRSQLGETAAEDDENEEDTASQTVEDAMESLMRDWFETILDNYNTWIVGKKVYVQRGVYTAGAAKLFLEQLAGAPEDIDEKHPILPLIACLNETLRINLYTALGSAYIAKTKKPEEAVKTAEKATRKRKASTSSSSGSAVKNSKQARRKSRTQIIDSDDEPED